MKEDLKKQKTETTRKAENTERQLSEARRKIKECEQLNEELLDKITNERGKQREEHPEPGMSRSASAAYEELKEYKLTQENQNTYVRQFRF